MINKLASKIKFLTAVVSGNISFKGKRKQELVQELASKGYSKDARSYDYLLGMPLWNMTQDKISALTSEHQQINRQLNTLARKTPQQIWNNDLDELLDAIVPKQKKKRKNSPTARPNKKSKSEGKN